MKRNCSTTLRLFFLTLLLSQHNRIAIMHYIRLRPFLFLVRILSGVSSLRGIQSGNKFVEKFPKKRFGEPHDRVDRAFDSIDERLDLRVLDH